MIRYFLPLLSIVAGWITGWITGWVTASRYSFLNLFGFTTSVLIIIIMHAVHSSHCKRITDELEYATKKNKTLDDELKKKEISVSVLSRHLKEAERANMVLSRERQELKKQIENAESDLRGAREKIKRMKTSDHGDET